MYGAIDPRAAPKTTTHEANPHPIIGICQLSIVTDPWTR